MTDGLASHTLGTELASWTRERVEALVTRYLVAWQVPRVFAGFQVGPDVTADLIYTLGLLDRTGHGTVAGTPAVAAVGKVLQAIDGPATNTFASYRVAETLRRYGTFADNPIFDGWSHEARANIAEACDSTAWIALLEQKQLPANYVAVLARCELARHGLGLPVDEETLNRLIAGVEELLTRNPHGWHDDSPVRAGRYDIYAADLYLFLQPLVASPRFAARLEPNWQRGVGSVLSLVESIAARNGAAFAWGRSTGALSVCMTIELAALALAKGLGNSSLWLSRAAHAFERFKEWMRDDLIDAHRYRSPYSYRGPHRLLQMTLDALGKLAWAAAEILRTPARSVTESIDIFPEHDRFVRFADDQSFGLWSYRSPELAFVVPLVGSTLNDYLPAPQCPGFLEVPIEVDLPTGVPVVIKGGTRFTSGGAPTHVVHTPDTLQVTWSRFAKAGAWDCTDSMPAVKGQRTLDLHAARGRLQGRERLHFDELPEVVAMQFSESGGRRLNVSFATDAPHTTAVIETAGIKDYRSFWGELPRVHQIDISPAADIELEWTVAPVLRVATSAGHHHYNRTLYGPLAGRVDERQLAYEWFTNPRAPELADFLRELDVFHLHWPEWVSHSVEDHRVLIERLRAADVRIVWTQHNLVPHSRDAHLVELYRLWAACADALIHHSHCGETLVRNRYAFRPEAIHRVIAHPHFGPLRSERDADTRADVERELGLRPCSIRLGIIGAPRPEKDVQLALDAFAACQRNDLGLLVLSLAGERVPDDPRVTALMYEMVDRATYDRRLSAIDALIFPIRPGELLTSGVVGDAVAAGLPSLTSDWEFLAETLGDAAICYGRTQADLTACLDRLDPTPLARSADAARALQPVYAGERVAEQLLDLLTELGSAKL